MKSYAETSKILIRYALSLLLIWFGLNQLIDPISFLGYVPKFVPFSASLMLILNGLLDLVLGRLLITGFKVRIVSFIIFLHVIVIALSLGYNDVAARDVFIALVSLSIFLSGSDRFSLDRYLLKRKMRKD